MKRDRLLLIRQRYQTALAAIAGALIALTAYQVHGVPAFEEGNLIENLTVLLYAVTVGAVLSMHNVPVRTRMALATIISMLAARELDLHKAFTTDSIFKSDYYLKSAASLPEKLLSILFILILAAIIGWLMLSSYRNFIADLRARKAYAWSLVTGLALMGLSKTIDGIGRKLRGWFGLDMDAPTKLVFRAFEESFEMMIPLAFLVACLQVSSGLKNRE